MSKNIDKILMTGGLIWWKLLAPPVMICPK